MTVIHTTMDYFTAVAERQRLENLLDVGIRQFHGYGLELFQSSMLSKIRKLNVAIEQFEICSGYSELAPYNFWSSRIRNECLEVDASLPPEESSIFANSNVSDSRDLQRIPGNIVEQMITTASGVLSPIQPVPPKQAVFGFADVPYAEVH